MAQRVDYHVLPNTPDRILLDRTITILAQIDREQPTFKAFRAWMRELNIWKKDETPAALEFFGVRGLDGRGRISLAPIAKRLLAAEDPTARQKLLFRHLLDANSILVKYVVEALDTESDGRLHSTHELHRYITSYAYPGASIGLVAFQQWVKWFQAAAGIKIIGIRWALDENAREALPKIRALDVEEFLEDEELESEEEEGDENDDEEKDAASSAAPRPSAPLGAGAEAPEPPSPGAELELPPDEEDFPDMPPEAPAPAIDEEAAARFAAQLGIDEEDMGPSGSHAAPGGVAAPGPMGVAAVARPERTAVPVQSAVLRPLRAPVSTGGISPQERLETVRQVKAWWEGFAFKRRVRAEDLGFEPACYEADPRRFLLRLMTAAVLVDHEALEAPIGDFLSRLDGVDAFTRIGGERGGLDAVLAELDWFEGDPWGQRLAENLVHTSRFRARLANAGEALEAVQQSRSGAKVAERVFLDLFGGTFLLPPFWLIREMYVLGLWGKQAFASVACVPTYRTRLSAFRLGFVDSFYADGFPELLRMSQVLSRFFDESCDFNAPLDQLADGFGCQLRCPLVLSCSLACREKTSV